jgi:hypothetical protein
MPNMHTVHACLETQNLFKHTPTWFVIVDEVMVATTTVAIVPAACCIKKPWPLGTAVSSPPHHSIHVARDLLRLRDGRPCTQPKQCSSWLRPTATAVLLYCCTNMFNARPSAAPSLQLLLLLSSSEHRMTAAPKTCDQQAHNDGVAHVLLVRSRPRQPTLL